MKTHSIAVVAITKKGTIIAKLIAEELKASLHLPKDLGVSEAEAVYFDSLKMHVHGIFYEYKAFVFVMSLGIVNRIIAPLIRSKYTDPAVVTIDEVARYVISTLSGHEGGANELAYLVSTITGADPVITTATEANRFYICGLGCKKNEDTKKILDAVKKGCQEIGIVPEQLRCLSSAWIKKDEPAIKDVARQLRLPLRFIPKWLIDFYYETNPYAPRSRFVFEKIGVFGVAEPCAMLSGRNTELVLSKNYNGVKVAIAKERLYEQ